VTNRRALLVTSDFPPGSTGGIARYYYDLCRGAGKRVGVITPGTCYAEFDAQQEFDIFRTNVTTSPKKVLRLVQVFVLVWLAVRTARRRGYATLIFGHWYLATAAPLVRAFTRLKCVTVLHGGELLPYQSMPLLVRLVTACLRCSTLIICNSNYTKTEYTSLDATAPSTVVITPGVDSARFAGRDGRVVRARYGLGGSRVLLTVGNLVPRKGHDVVISALSALIGRGCDVQYLIVGCGPEEARLRDLAVTLGVGERVTFAGRVREEELPDYYDACDVFVMLSRRANHGRQAIEGFGIVYLEANCCGKPVIGVRSGGVMEAVDHGRTGLLVEPEDTLNQAIDAMSSLLSDKARAQQLGEAGETRVRAEFSLQAKGQQLVDCIDRFTDGSNRG
jgi:phosphatidyl-myo-inositol dimannoside synthase